MESRNKYRKVWVKPVIQKLNIKKDTFSGSVTGGAEGAGKNGPPKKV